MMPDDELQAMADSITANGLSHPIELLDNQVIDGRNRLRACEIAGVAPRFREVQTDNPIGYVINANIHRRHLTTAQRAAIAAELANLSHGTNRFEEKVEGSNDPSTGISIKEAAEAMNVSEPSVKRAKKVMREDPAAHEATKAGRRKTSKRFSTVNIYYEEGLIPEAKSGSATQKLNAEVDKIAPGAREAQDKVRVRAACRVLRVRREGPAIFEPLKEEAQTARASLTTKEETKLDAAIRKAKRALEIEFELKIEERVTQWLDEVLPKYNMEFEFYKKSNDTYNGVLSYEQYKDLEGFLHPDRHPGNEARASRLFSLVRENKFLLCGQRPAELEQSPGSLPKTAAELMARRKTKH